MSALAIVAAVLGYVFRKDMFKLNQYSASVEVYLNT